MILNDGRGKNKVEQAKRNRSLVREFFENNPGSTLTDCQRNLNLSYTTVRRHLDEIMKG